MKQKAVPIMFVLLWMGSFSCLFAQNKYHKVVGTSRDDRATDAIFLNNDLMVIGGFSTDFSAPFDDIFLAALDTVGDTVWTQTYRTSLDEKIIGMSLAEDNQIIAAGNSGNNPMLIKLDSLADTVFVKTYDDPTTSFGGYFNDVTYDGNTNYVATGLQQGQTLVVKTDMDGNTQWAGKYGLGIGNKVIASSTGDYLVVGESSGTAKAIKINPNGTINWSKLFNTNFGMKILDIIENLEGYLVLGVTNQPTSGDDAFLMQLDFNGNILWKRRYFNNFTNQVSSMAVVDDTTILAGGLYNHNGNINSFSWIMKINTAQKGDTVFNKFYQAINGGVDLTKVLYTSDERIVGIGTDLGSVPMGGNNFYAMKLDSNRQQAGCAPVQLNTSDFVIDTFAVTVMDDTSNITFMPTEEPLGLVDPEGIVEISEELKSQLHAQAIANGLALDTVAVDIFGRNKDDEPYQFNITTKLPGEMIDIYGIETSDNLIRVKGKPVSPSELETFATYHGNTTRWDESTGILVIGCEAKTIGTIDLAKDPGFGMNPTSNSFQGMITYGPSFNDTLLDFLELFPTYNASGILYKRPSTGGALLPQTTFKLDINGNYEIPNVPATNPGESYAIHLDFPGFPVVNPHNNITFSNRLSGELSYDFEIHDTFILGVINSDSTATSIQTPIVDDFDLKAYPNPASEKINLSFYVPEKSAQVTMSDFYGRDVYQHPQSFTIGQHEIQIPLSHLSAGIYTLSVEIPGIGLQVQKLMVK